MLLFAALGENGYGVALVKVLAVPFGGGGIVGDVGVFGFQWPVGIDICGGVDMDGQFYAIGAVGAFS